MFLLSTCWENVAKKGELVENLIQNKIIPNKTIFLHILSSTRCVVSTSNGGFIFKSLTTMYFK